MQMTSAQYMRIETIAGGAGCTARQFVKACHSRLSFEGKRRAARQARHDWIRSGLTIRTKARRIAA